MPPRPLLSLPLCLAVALAGCGNASGPAPQIAGGAPPPVPAGGSGVASPTDVTAFRGSSAEEGALGLRVFGFERTGRRGGAELWQNRASGACAEIVTEGGRFAQITMVASATC